MDGEGSGGDIRAGELGTTLCDMFWPTLRRADSIGMWSKADLMAMAINSRMTFIGAWFFQCKWTQGGELALLEVARRSAAVVAPVPSALALR